MPKQALAKILEGLDAEMLACFDFRCVSGPRWSIIHNFSFIRNRFRRATRVNDTLVHVISQIHRIDRDVGQQLTRKVTTRVGGRFRFRAKVRRMELHMVRCCMLIGQRLCIQDAGVIDQRGTGSATTSILNGPDAGRFGIGSDFGSEIALLRRYRTIASVKA